MRKSPKTAVLRRSSSRWVAANLFGSLAIPPKRTLDDFNPARDNAICKDIVPDGKTPADGLFKRLGYAHRVYTLALNIDGRRTSDYVSATIDVDIDIPLFTPVDEYRKTGEQGKLDQLIRQSVLGRRGRR